jgi:hypothetical protein
MRCCRPALRQAADLALEYEVSWYGNVTYLRAYLTARD